MDKQWYKSKTIWGSIIMVFSLVLSSFGYQLGADEQAMLIKIATAITAIVGTLLAIIGRVKARKRIVRKQYPPAPSKIAEL